MAAQAQVTSVDAIESFRASLILYLSKARPALDEVSGEVLRTRLWLQEEQRKRWENEMRQRARKLEQAQAELFTARLSKLQEVSPLQQMAVHRAQRAVHEAETKLALLKKWDRELENRSEPLLKQVDQLHGFLTSDMTRAVAYLAQAVKALEAYAGVAPPGALPPEGSGPNAGKGDNFMNLSGSKGRLTGATKELMLRWSEAKNYWRDDKRQEFERRYMQELLANVDKAVTVIEKLDELLKKVRNDCE